ncbi:NADAR family protein [Enterococcus sp. AZ180]|uniref:NADAR family protein n=1 Tax=Enterococcus sp. AZ180 TaxID=2774961 RepID=UPI003F281B2A
MLFKDKEVADKIMLAKYPKDAKYLGRQVRNYDDKIWSEKRYEIMVSVLKEKFHQNLYLENKLRKTGNSTLVEASPYDKIWGVGTDYKHALNPNNWRGQNLLGKALMEVRESL